MKSSPCTSPYDRRSALPSVDDADIISLAEALARGMKPLEGLYDSIYDLIEIDAQAAEDQG
jgi:hypothetical protein